MRRRNFLTLCGIGPIVFSAGCSSSTVIGDLDLVVTGVEAVFPTIAGIAGLPPAVVSQVSMYLAAVSSASAQASDILAGSGTTAQKAAQIVALFANIAAPLLPAGTPQVIISAINSVVQAVVKFLANFQGSKVTASRAQTSAPVSDSDAAKLRTIKTRALAAHRQAQALVR